MIKLPFGLSLWSWIIMMILAVVMSANNIYTSLLTGWGEGGSIIAVVLCLILFSKRDSNIVNYNLGQTMASAGGSVGFTTAIVASIYLVKPDWNPDLFMLGLFVTSLSILGVTLAIPLRKYIVHWFFPSAVACATILDAVTSKDARKALRARAIMLWSGLVAAVLTFPTKVATSHGGDAIWGTAFAGKTKLDIDTGLSRDPLLYGIGMVVGPRIGVSMLVGAAVATFWYMPMLDDSGRAAETGDYVKWAAVAFMTLPAFAGMFFQNMYTQPQLLPKRFQDVQDKATPWTEGQQLAIVLVAALAAITAAFAAAHLFEIGMTNLFLSICIGAPLCIMLGKVASTTDVNAVRLLAIIVLFFFSLSGAHSAVWLLGIGIAGAALASIAVDLFYDLRTGYLVEADPKRQVVVQYIGVLLTGFVSVFFLHMLATEFGFGEGKYFPAPGAVNWATMAEGFSAGASSLSSGVIWMIVIVSVVGIVMSFFECHPITRAFAPSPFAIGIALLLPFEMSAAICAGGLLRLGVILQSRHRDRKDDNYDALQHAGHAGPHEEQMSADFFQAGSAIFAAAALTGVAAVILMMLGVFHPPAH